MSLGGDDTGDGGVSEIQSKIDSLGCGWYQVLLLLAIGITALLESMEMGVISPLHTALARAYKLNRSQRSTLPPFTYLGSMVGMIIAGPLADLWGRKNGLVLALVLIFLSSCIQAILPTNTHFVVLLLLRVFSGIAGAMATPTGISLAVESCPRSDRLRLVFGIWFMSSLGYLLEAMAVDWFMPHFGEAASDNWRGLCLFVGCPAILSLPLVLVIRESPTFLAISGRWRDCQEALDRIASLNGQQTCPGTLSRRTSKIWRSLSFSETRSTTLWGLAVVYLPILLLLVFIDSFRSFYTAGSAYLCKDLFEMTRLNKSISPTLLNVFASISPLLGMIIGERFVWIGMRCLMLGCAITAAACTTALVFPAVRSLSWLLLLLVLIFKMTYGPMGTCVALMKVEAFPTEFRATAFAAICVAGKLLCALGPTLVEALKEDAEASSWEQPNLAGYMVALASSALISGLLSLRVPETCSGDGSRLKDFSKLDSVREVAGDESLESTCDELTSLNAKARGAYQATGQ